MPKRIQKNPELINHPAKLLLKMLYDSLHECQSLVDCPFLDNKSKEELNNVYSNIVFLIRLVGAL